MEHDVPKAGRNSCAGAGGGGVGDQEMMVGFELEAAEALAGLAHSSLRQGDDDHDADGDHPDPCDDNDLPPDDGATVVIPRDEQTEKKNSVSDPVKIDDEQRPELYCSTSYNKSSVAGGRSRQPLTETEKEARRLRRVLANRESARQTIRRRQAIFEELTRKASELAIENENLKGEKEQAVKEYDSLKNINDRLREEMAKLEAGEILKVTKPVPTECPASASTSAPFFPYDQHSVVSLHWHSLIQPTLQCRSQNDNATQSVFPMAETCRPYLLTDQRYSNTIPNPGALLYVLPLPCFFPLHSPSNAALPQSSNPIERQVETHLSIQCSTDFPPQSSLPLVINRGTHSGTRTKLGDGHNQACFGTPLERHDESEGTHPRRTVLMPTPLNCFRPSSSGTGGRLNVTPQQEGSSEEAVVSVTGYTAVTVSEENRKPAAHNGRKPVDASTAAKARRRRRELMKLKSTQPGQFPTN